MRADTIDVAAHRAAITAACAISTGRSGPRDGGIVDRCGFGSRSPPVRLHEPIAPG
jgi:hypothetical protein